MTHKKVSVIGAGTMGAGIAQVFAQNSISVTLFDTEERILASALTVLRKRLEPRIESGKISAVEVEKIFGKINISVELKDVKDSDFIIEAIFEDMKIKKEILKRK